MPKKSAGLPGGAEKEIGQASQATRHFRIDLCGENLRTGQLFHMRQIRHAVISDRRNGACSSTAWPLLHENCKENCGHERNKWPNMKRK